MANRKRMDSHGKRATASRKGRSVKTAGAAKAAHPTQTATAAHSGAESVVTPEVEAFCRRIRVFLQKANGRPLARRDLTAKCRGRGKAPFLRAITQLLASGEVVERRSGLVLSANAGMFRATMHSLHRTYGFATPEDGGKEVFVAGRDLKGALPGDLVLLAPTGERNGTPEAAVMTVIHAAEAQVTGMMVEDCGTLRFLPDAMCRQSLVVTNVADCGCQAGDKVIATVVRRGTRHSEHWVRVEMRLGSADSAAACSRALVFTSGMPTAFSEAALAEAEQLEQRGILPTDCANRLDLRNGTDVVFTIDGFDAKDLDDAISIAKTETGYRLGVHIADVSHYVRPQTTLDAEAMTRGTSVYYADQVIPMLPKSLSNGICSLFPQVDRLTLSALMELDAQGELVRYSFEKTVIRSAVQGVYREVNAVLDGSADATLMEKYAPVLPSLQLLDALRQVRLAARKRRGAPSLETEESLCVMNEAGICCEIRPRTRGAGEELIEECMLLANEAAARLANERHLPFVYRVHTQPPAEKSQRLAEALDMLGISHGALEEPKPKDYSAVLESVKEHPLKPVVHQLVLRSMAKAAYDTEPLGHFGLALKDYAHFTSPIRRYPDLAVHRMLSSFLCGVKLEHALDFVKEAATRSTATELRAQQTERRCEDCYRAEYMLGQQGVAFDGIISGITDFGIYVMLENTVEGMVSVDVLLVGAYVYDGFFALTDSVSGRRYTLGQPMRVRCVRADVNSGHIDFVPEPLD